MVNEKRCLMFFILWLVTAGSVFGQGRPYEGPDDPASDIAAVREGWMNGNRVLTYFKNTGLIAEWPNFDLSKWPNDHTGTGMIDNLRLLICARVYLEPGTDNPVDDPLEIQSRADLDTLYYCQTSHTECFSDVNP